MPPRFCAAWRKSGRSSSAEPHVAASGKEVPPLSGTRLSWRLALVFAVVAVGAAWALSLPAIPEDPAYHHFADQRHIGGIPNMISGHSLKHLAAAMAVAWLLIMLRRRVGFGR